MATGKEHHLQQARKLIGRARYNFKKDVPKDSPLFVVVGGLINALDHLVIAIEAESHFGKTPSPR